MSSVGGCLWEVVAHKSLDHDGSKYFLIRIIILTAETHAPMPMQCYEVKVNGQFRAKNLVLPIEKFVSSTSKGYDNDSTPDYLFFAPLSVKWPLNGG